MTSISNTTQNRSTEENKPCVLMGDVRTEHFTYLTKKTVAEKQEDSVIRKFRITDADGKAAI